MLNSKNTSKIYNLILAFSAQALNLASGLILLPVVLLTLSSSEVGLWYVFMAMVGLPQVLEIGFQQTISRNVSYLFAGANDLVIKGLPNKIDTISVNHQLLDQAWITARQIYLKIAFTSFIILFGLGSLYIYSLVLNINHKGEYIIAWGIFSTGFIVNIYFGYMNAFLLAKNCVAENNKVILFGKLVFVIFGVAFLVLDMGLMGLGFASIISALFNRFLLKKIGVYESKINNQVQSSHKSKDGICLNDVFIHGASRLCLVNFGGYLIVRANMLIASSFLGLEVSASYGLAMQLFGTVSTMATTVYSINTPRLNAEQVHRNKTSLQIVFGQSLATAWIIIVAGGIFLLCLGGPILDMIGSHSKLPSLFALTLLLLIILLETNQSLCSAYISTRNEIPFVKSALATGFAVVGLSALLVYCQAGIYAVILSQGIAGLLYNYWHWPHEAVRRLDLTFAQTLRVGLLSVYQNILDLRKR